MLTALACSAVTLAAVPNAAMCCTPQDPPRDVTSHFVVPDGLRVTLWAESPALFNPTAIDVDSRGRMWIAEGVNYRKWGGRNPGREHPDGERIVILDDTDGDGVADSSKVFVQDPELLVPLGIAVVGDWVYVSCSPSLLRYRDTDGDDVADQKEVVLTGFGGRDHDHGLHAVTAGPDGRLWFNCGNAGPHVVTDRDGFTVRSGSSYSGGGPASAPNGPGLRSDDGRVWTGGLVLRVDPDGHHLRVVAHNFRNPYEVAIDAFGDLWQSDNDDDGNQCCRTLWVMPGGNHGYFSPDGARGWGEDRLPGQDVWRAHWHQDDPGVVPAGNRNGGGGPTGVCVYEGGLLPPRFVGAVLNADAGRGTVYAHFPKADGGGFAFDVEHLIRAKDDVDGRPAQWFRPSDVCVGTDGAIYVADWYDPGVGGHAMGDRDAYGRILRIAPADAPKRADPHAFDDPVAALACPAVNPRYRAWQAVHAPGADAVWERLAAAARSADARFRARLWWLVATAGSGRALPFQHRIEQGAARDAVVAVRTMLAQGASPQSVRQSLDDTMIAPVRRELALALREPRWAQDHELLVELARRYEPGDRTGLEALGLAAEGDEEELFAALLAEHGKAPTQWPMGFADVAWRLHPVSAVPAFLARALAPELDAAAREQAIDALAFVDDAKAADAMLTIADAGPDEARARATGWLVRLAGDRWAQFGIADRVASRSRDGATKRFDSGVLTAGAKRVDVALGGADALWLVVTDGGDGNSHDWATWGDAKLVGPAGELALAKLPWLGATTGWGQLNKDHNAGGGPLAIGGARFATGIGAHAPSEIALRLPKGYDRFVATVGPDDGGTSQPGARTSLSFEVWANEPPDRSAFVAARAALLDERTTMDARIAAATALVDDGEGAPLLASLASDGRLPAPIKDAIADRMRRHADLGVRALAAKAFARPGSALAALPPIAELAAMPGDAERGRDVFFGPKAQCAVCHAHGGQGRDLGPDLTRIGDKYDATGILAAVLDPSAGIAFGYETWLVETKGGGAYFGFLLADGPRLVLKDAAGQRHVIDAADVTRRTAQPVSLMPDTIALGLAPQDLADLVAFLRWRPFDGLDLGPARALFDGESLAGWVGHFPDGTATAAVWSVRDGVLVDAGQPIGYLRTTDTFTDYVLTVEWRFTGKPGNGGVLLRQVGPDKVWPKSIEAQLESGSAGDIWNIDEFPMQVATERTEGRHTRKLQPSSELPLGQWNRYEIVLNRGALRLSVNGVVQNEAFGCERVAGHICLQAEGAPMEFRKVELRPIR